MAEALNSENAAFWLPSHFLTDDDFLADEVCLKRDTIRNDFDLFDNSLAGFNLHSSLDSPVSSTETELGDSNDSNIKNDDEFMAELTRHLAQSSLNYSSDESHNVQKPWMFSTSPQSTLTGFGPWTSRSGFSSNGSPNGPSQVPSPPLTPPAKNDAAWELLFEAAGQVARLKMNALAAQMKQQNQNRGIMRAPQNIPFSAKSHHHNHNSFYDFPQHEQLKRQSNGRFYCQHHSHNHNQQRSAPLGLPQSAWPPLRPNHHHHHRQPSNGSGMRSSYLNGPGIPGIKRQSTGTGVFLPRRVGTTPTHQQPEPRKKASVIHPARVVEVLNMNYEEIKMKNEFQSKHNSRYGTGMLSEHEILMARRNALLERQKKNLLKNEMVTHEISLPSDWTY
ncbi:uncharacterized protein LOC130802979 [Amaranthus tricolor]|uniref:uncharacterized protein LOC130802979 n=1 Tax=Amaranthus tricolor TaxID=29722 RepID=UPI00258FBB34|nr:uncharacterized protein LOC130802979 [Amaranthus tricolor]